MFTPMTREELNTVTKGTDIYTAQGKVLTVTDTGGHNPCAYYQDHKVGYIVVGTRLTQQYSAQDVIGRFSLLKPDLISSLPDEILNTLVPGDKITNYTGRERAILKVLKGSKEEVIGVQVVSLKDTAKTVVIPAGTLRVYYKQIK